MPAHVNCSGFDNLIPAPDAGQDIDTPEGLQDFRFVFPQGFQHLSADGFPGSPSQLISGNFKADSETGQLAQNFSRGHGSNFPVVRLFGG